MHMCGTTRHLLEGRGNVPHIAFDQSSLEMHCLDWQERLVVYQAFPVPKASPSQKTKCFHYFYPLSYEFPLFALIYVVCIFAHHSGFLIARRLLWFSWIMKFAPNAVCTYNHYIPCYAVCSTVRYSLLIPVLILRCMYNTLHVIIDWCSTLKGSCQFKICACRGP
jgi:hypothetical protein